MYCLALCVAVINKRCSRGWGSMRMYYYVMINVHCSNVDCHLGELMSARVYFSVLSG